eukprot:COSAG06_NODE_3087_length_5878_cov_75.802042_2_plen_146_part_00
MEGAFTPLINGRPAVGVHGAADRGPSAELQQTRGGLTISRRRQRAVADRCARLLGGVAVIAGRSAARVSASPIEIRLFVCSIEEQPLVFVSKSLDVREPDTGPATSPGYTICCSGLPKALPDHIACGGASFSRGSRPSSHAANEF